MVVKKRPPTPKTYMAYGDTVEEATDRAWNKAKKGGAKPGWYHIISIQFWADNPINEYKVTIGAGP